MKRPSAAIFHTGRILGSIDLSGLMDERELAASDAVLNGIAYDSKGDRLFVTGKLWPKLFETKVVRKSLANLRCACLHIGLSGHENRGTHQ